MADGYAGDVTPAEAWKILQEDKNAVLVDCRTSAEWNYVGRPDLSDIGKEPGLIEWQRFPGGDVNASFVDDVKKMGVSPDQTILFLCRSGQRSISAAVAMTQAGFAKCYNILEGFEGAKDADGHRGTRGGWKVAGLPWQQG